MRALQPDQAVGILDASKQDVEKFAPTIGHARKIYTDRLHVMLLAAMLGKPVVAYPTSHRKLEIVYQHSLAGWAQVRFQGV